MQKTLKISGFVLQVILFATIILLFITFLSAKFSVMGLRSFTVATGSMEPKIHVGSIVFTKPFSEYKIGNILTFNRGRITVTHRIVGKENGGFITKGDANNSPDKIIVTQNSIVGRDILIIPYMGKFINFFKSPFGFMLFIFIPITAYIILEARVFKKEWEIEAERKSIERNNIMEA